MSQREQFSDWIARVFLPESFIRVADSNDPIGTILHSHLMVEELLVGWSETQLNRPGVISGLRIGFDARLELAKRLGLPSELVDAIKKIDNIRNRIGHRLNYNLEQSEIDSFANAVDAFQLSNVSTSSCKEEFIQTFDAEGRERIPTTQYTNASPQIGFVIAFGALSRKLISLYGSASN